MQRILQRVAFMLLLATLAGAAHCAVFYVKTNGLDANNGRSWVYAKKTVQAAIDIAAPGSEVWVASGTYTNCIKIKAGVSLYGGFAGGEILRSQRKFTNFITTLDGGSADSVITVPAGATSATVIDGFTIQNGRSAYGGGIYAEDSSVTITNNIIKNNKAAYYGGGIYGEASTLTLQGNTIKGNQAAFGAGIACYNNAAPSIVGNTISFNTADYDGSGLYCYSNSAPVISNNVIASNSAASEGAGVYCDDASPVIVNNTICSNNATTDGGGLACRDASPVIANNIIAFGSSGVRSEGSGKPSLFNNALFENTAYHYSGLTAGIDDQIADPIFIKTTDYQLSSNSQLINAGNNDAPGIGSADIASAPRVQGGAVDIGAYEAPYMQPALTSLADAKTAPKNSWIVISNSAVSAAFPGAFYIAADNRVSGMRVEKASHSILQDQRASLEGVVRTNANGERYIHATTATGSAGSAVQPFYLGVRSIGGVQRGMQEGITSGGVNNIGLLVKTSGKYTYISPDTFTIVDGSGESAKCITTNGITLNPTWSSVTVTGVVSCEKVEGKLKRLIRVRNQSDIAPY